MSPLERQLLARYAAERDADAFRRLFVLHKNMVYATCRRILGNRADAEDVTQACFLNLARDPTQVRTSLAGWLHRVAVGKSVDLMRQDRARRARETNARPASRDPGASSWNEISACVDEAVEDLPEGLRIPLIRYYLEEREQEEIAAELGIKQSTVARRLQRAVAKLRVRLRKAGWAGSATLLATFLATRTIEAPPATLTAALGKMAVAGVGAGTSTAAATAASASTAAGTAGGTGAAASTATAATGGIGIVKLSLIGLATAAAVTTAVVVTQVGGQETAMPEPERAPVTDISPKTSIAPGDEKEPTRAFTVEDWQALLARAMQAEAEIRAAINELEIVHETFPLPEEAKTAMLNRVHSDLEETFRKMSNAPDEAELGPNERAEIQRLVSRLDRRYTEGETRRRKTKVAFADDKFRIERDSPSSVAGRAAPDAPRSQEKIVMDGKTLQEYDASSNMHRINALPLDMTDHPYCDDYQQFIMLLKPFTSLLAHCEFSKGRLLEDSPNETRSGYYIADAVMELTIPEGVRFFGVTWQKRSVRAWVVRGGPSLLRLEFLDAQGRVRQRLTRDRFVAMRTERDATGKVVRTHYGGIDSMNQEATWYADKETREYWTLENRDGTLLKTGKRITITDGVVPDARVYESWSHVFELDVPPDAKVFDNRPDQVIEMLQYREQFLPEGYALARDVSPNPGLLRKERLAAFLQTLGSEIQPKRVYRCVFEAAKGDGTLDYTICELNDEKDVESMKRALDEFQERRKADSPNSFSQSVISRKYVITVAGISYEAAGKALLENLLSVIAY